MQHLMYTKLSQERHSEIKKEHQSKSMFQICTVLQHRV